MATPKQAHALTSYFNKKYKEKYGVVPQSNRYAARWGFDSILMDMGESDVKALIDYYFTTANSQRHPLEWFFYNYDKLVESKRVADTDRELLARRREESRKRAEEWRKRLSGED